MTASTSRRTSPSRTPIVRLEPVQATLCRALNCERSCNVRSTGGRFACCVGRGCRFDPTRLVSVSYRSRCSLNRSGLERKRDPGRWSRTLACDRMTAHRQRSSVPGQSVCLHADVCLIDHCLPGCLRRYVWSRFKYAIAFVAPMESKRFLPARLLVQVQPEARVSVRGKWYRRVSAPAVSQLSPRTDEERRSTSGCSSGRRARGLGP